MLLDDVMSELDAAPAPRAGRLLRGVGGQSVITTTDLEHVPGGRRHGVARVAVARRGGSCGEALAAMTPFGAPHALSFALERLRGRAGARDDARRGQRGLARSVVGESIASPGEPVSERGGVLTVSCSASVWAHELDLMAPDILEA